MDPAVQRAWPILECLLPSLQIMWSQYWGLAGPRVSVKRIAEDHMSSTSRIYQHLKRTRRILADADRYGALHRRTARWELWVLGYEPPYESGAHLFR